MEVINRRQVILIMWNCFLPAPHVTEILCINCSDLTDARTKHVSIITVVVFCVFDRVAFVWQNAANAE